MLPLFLVACKDDEPEQNLFSIAVQLSGEGTLGIGQHDCEITIDGYGQYITVDLLGDFDSFRVGNSIPSWLMVTTGERRIKIAVPDIAGTETRSGKIDFIVYKGNAQNSGSISITQKGLTYEDMLKHENKAIKKFLENVTVINEVPAENAFEVGSDAPFYKLAETGVYMQVISKGTEFFNVSERVYFRFERWNLLTYLNTGKLGNSEGNMNDMSFGITYFTFGGNDVTTKQWGDGIQLAIRMKKLDLSNWTLINFFGTQDYQYLTSRGTYKVRKGSISGLFANEATLGGIKMSFVLSILAAALACLIVVIACNYIFKNRNKKSGVVLEYCLLFPWLLPTILICYSYRTYFNAENIWYVGNVNLYFAEHVRILLVLAYTVVKLPFSLRMIKAAFYASDEELERICKLAQADEFIMQFPDQYDTHIEQGGSNVSGGQKQRLCIARALLKKPKILILDDSTSAVDTKTDAQIRKALREYIPETTKIIIAQRISSVQDADRILVMDGGTICNIGTHEELLKTSEIYREVYTSQNKGGDSDEK